MSQNNRESNLKYATYFKSTCDLQPTNALGNPEDYSFYIPMLEGQVRKGADLNPNITRDDGTICTAMEYAVEKNIVALAQYLISKGIVVTQQYYEIAFVGGAEYNEMTQLLGDHFHPGGNHGPSTGGNDSD